MTTHKAIELVASVYGLAAIVLFLFNHGAHRKPTPTRDPNMLKPYESYTLMKETEMGWRDKR